MWRCLLFWQYHISSVVVHYNRSGNFCVFLKFYFVFCGSMPETTLKVKMTCGGCVAAVERVLSNLDGVDSYEVSLEKQTVVVKGSADPQKVFEAVEKTGKETELIN
eukprot:TRINITY_DN30481_c0_g1_i5.p3 TRINITY_DN30481_c0_g1~~TRINITY_DN30481_c0_g1_i5.p3  ORF type:complete len:106 (-),score=14.94 TRINITY_DN30481_c0_g1_i5:294-611(-)